MFYSTRAPPHCTRTSSMCFLCFASSLPAATAATEPAVQSEPSWPRPGRAFTARTAASASPPSAPSPKTLLAPRSTVTMATAAAAAAVSLMTTSTECCGRHTSVVFRQEGGWAQHDRDPWPPSPNPLCPSVCEWLKTPQATRFGLGVWKGTTCGEVYRFWPWRLVPTSPCYHSSRP